MLFKKKFYISSEKAKYYFLIDIISKYRNKDVVIVGFILFQ